MDRTGHAHERVHGRVEVVGEGLPSFVQPQFAVDDLAESAVPLPQAARDETDAWRGAVMAGEPGRAEAGLA